MRISDWSSDVCSSDLRLIQRCLTLDDVDEIIYNTAFTTHDQVQVAQAYVKVDNDSFVAAYRQSGGEACTGGGFAHTAFAGSHHNNSRHDDRIPLGIVDKTRNRNEIGRAHV